MHSSRAAKILVIGLSFLPAISFANPARFYLNKPGFHIAALFLQPGSDNLKYAVFVSGNQPFSQSWHNQDISPSYSPGFEVGLNYDFPCDYNLSLDWLYLNTTDSSSKQANRSLNPATVQFVGPPYDVGPAVFGIKHADGKVNFTFSSVMLNVGRLFEFNPNVQVRVFGGLDLLRINQTLTTVFSDLAGSVPVPTQAYGLLPDPSFKFQTKNVSQYLGVGPDIGVNIQVANCYGLGIVGQFLGTLTAGSISAKDTFTSTSQRLTLEGIGTSHQAITTPNSMNVVPGFDSKLGIFFNRVWPNFVDFTVEVGYRFAYYINAISQVMPDTLVQAGSVSTIPEFSTGTMAINSTIATYSPFHMQGPYINFTIDFA